MILTGGYGLVSEYRELGEEYLGGKLEGVLKRKELL
jgi:hypothetical protein